MGLLDRIFSGRDETPPTPQPVQVLHHNGVVISLLPNGRIDAWALETADHLWTSQGAGPMLAVQGSRVIDGQGVVRALHTGDRLFECGLSGVAVAVGEHLAVLGWHHMWREGADQSQVQGLDPSPDAACFRFEDGLLIVDPGAKFLQYLNLLSVLSCFEAPNQSLQECLSTARSNSAYFVGFCLQTIVSAPA